ncbi:MAG TPA: class I SAM-dependent methyltransferase, partial [Ramlibacter sp.]
METSAKARTGEINGKLWGTNDRDWAELQEPLVANSYEAVFDRAGLSRGQWYCDVGCGAGLAAMTAASRGAHVTGLDASESLLEIASERVPDGHFRKGDIEELPFESQSFDLVTGFNSFQYAGNPRVALQEARRICKPSGHVAIMVWGPPEGMQAAAIVAALKPLLPPPPPGAPGPFALSDKAALTALVESAGLRPVDIDDVESLWRYPDLPTALRALGSSGVAA